MRRIDELHLQYPFVGAQMLRDLLWQEGYAVGRRQVATLMRRMGTEALYRKPSLSRRQYSHQIYPYLLRDLTITRPNHMWAADITYIPMRLGFVYRFVVLGCQFTSQEFTGLLKDQGIQISMDGKDCWRDNVFV